MMGKVPNLIPDAQSVDALDEICRLIGTSTESSDEIDRFGAALASRQEVGQTDLFRSALRMPLSEATLKATVGASLASWIQTLSPERLKPFLAAAGSRVEQALPDYRDRLLDLWESNANPEFAWLATGDDASQLERLQQRWAAVKPLAALDRALDVLDIISELGTKETLATFANAVGNRLAALPKNGLSALPSFMRGLRSQAVSRAPLIVERRRG
jgi:hypothetical protein